MPKIKRHYWRAKEMSDLTVKIVQSICNLTLERERESTSSISNSNILLYNSANNVSNNSLWRQNICSNNYQLNDDFDNLEEVNSNFNYFEECNNVLENENMNDNNFDISKVTNIVNAPAPNNLADYGFNNGLLKIVFYMLH